MRKMRPLLGIATLCVIAAVAVVSGPLAAAGPAAVGLGSAGAYAVLAGSTVTNTGGTVINGDLGVSPGKAVTGFPPGDVNGAVHRGDASAANAQDDLTTAYNRAAGRTPVTRIATQLGGQLLTAGVYDSASGTFQITGTVTLDAEGDPDAVFIFLTDSTLITASASRVRVINGADACRVFWKVGSSATLGTGTTFRGNILALTSITLNNGATVRGRLLARNGAVTLDNNTVTRVVCQAAPQPTPTPKPTPNPTPEPTPPPTEQPTAQPTEQPTGQPTEQPTAQPTGQPTEQPTAQPTGQPTEQPTGQPTEQPTAQPTEQPNRTPRPTEQPNRTPQPTATAEIVPVRTPGPHAGATPAPTRKPTMPPTDTVEGTPGGGVDATPWLALMAIGAAAGTWILRRANL